MKKSRRFFLLLTGIVVLRMAFGQSIALENITTSPGENVLVPINFTGMNNIGAILLFVEFDETVLTFNGITNISPEGTGTFYNYIPNPSRVGLSWIAPGMSGVNFPNGKYLDLEFTFNSCYSDLEFSADCEIGDWFGNIIPVTYSGATVSEPLLTLTLNVFLQGAYDPNSPGIMKTSLTTADVVPLAHPFKPALPYYGNNNPNWYFSGSENVSTLPSGCVDWVLIELRDAASLSSATASSMIAQKPCFLLSNGLVVDLDGVSIPRFCVNPSQGLFVVVRHRNHLGIMSSGPVAGFSNFYYYNFTLGPDKVAGGSGGYVEINNGLWGMVSGDINADNLINNLDITNAWRIEAGENGYFGSDSNMDAQVENKDKNDLLFLNLSKTSGVPE
ncbi:MAG: hypothetical protein K9G76_12800 [Bacteroidales bacterium]|nr:hypothetical protein [Bacteroidales bacterium]MCF8405650.1 hypothetical protein [Bacteroidales bacterium]